MGLLEDLGNQALDAVGLGSFLKKNLAPPDFKNDFPDGFVFTEIVKGAESTKIKLNGFFAPKDSFEFGGTQQLIKEFYPGNPEPSFQVLGPRESDFTIIGDLKTKRFHLVKDDPTISMKSLRSSAEKYQELLDAMRIRGNLIKFSLGEWTRYGFIEETKFTIRTLADIKYEIKMSIVGHTKPTYNKNASDSIKINADVQNLLDAVSKQLDAAKNYPDTMPTGVIGLLNDAIGFVAGKIAIVTGLLQGIVDDAERLSNTANRAVGVIRNARASISRMERQIAYIKFNAGVVASQFQGKPAQQSKAVIKNSAHINKVQTSFQILAALLAALQVKLSKLQITVPMVRHLVKNGDTLQRLSIKYYNTADNWNLIYDHNKLKNTVLNPGQVLEIPKK